MTHGKLFISGIDTDSGKSFATGWLARKLMDEGHTVVTQKFIQTGCTDYSEDIDLHRQIMQCGTLDVDTDHTTAPIIFTYPASAQLAAEKDGREIDLSLVTKSTEALSKKFDIVLIEGAGGLMVPIADDYLTIDYVVEHNLPMALVTNARLGSINHTILSLEAIAARGIKLKYLLFNHHFDADKIIAADTRDWLDRYIKKHFADTEIIDIPTISL